MRRQIIPMVRQLCGCGCGKRLPPRKRGEGGRPKRYLNPRHRQRAVRLGVVLPEDDLTPAQIDAIIAQARAQQRYARVTGGAA